MDGGEKRCLFSVDYVLVSASTCVCLQPPIGVSACMHFNFDLKCLQTTKFAYRDISNVSGLFASAEVRAPVNAMRGETRYGRL